MIGFPYSLKWGIPYLVANATIPFLTILTHTPVIKHSVNCAVDLRGDSDPMPCSVHQHRPIQHPVAKLVADEATQTVLVPLRVTREGGVGGQYNDVLDVPPRQVSTSCGKGEGRGREGCGGAGGKVGWERYDGDGVRGRVRVG